MMNNLAFSEHVEGYYVSSFSKISISIDIDGVFLSFLLKSMIGFIDEFNESIGVHFLARVNEAIFYIILKELI